MSPLRRHVSVLAYHSVDDPRAFERQLDWLRARTNPVSLDALVANVRGGAPLPRRAVLVTFDDADPTLLAAAPMLAERSIPAVAFVVAGLLGTSEPWWWERVEESLGIEEVRRLKTVPNDERVRTVARLPQGVTQRRHLQPDELLELRRSGFAIGSHSLTHPCLDQCSDAEIDHEVAESRAVLSGVLGEAPRAFAYPNGNFDPRVRAAVEAAGYEIAFLFDHRRSALPPADALAISRLRVNSYTSRERLAAIVTGVHSAILHARGRA